MLQNRRRRELHGKPNELGMIGSDEKPTAVVIAIPKCVVLSVKADVFHVSCSLGMGLLGDRKVGRG
jgi:hypothetical protein